jgi:RNA polymerase sigma-70 factor (ECF subfamily)
MSAKSPGSSALRVEQLECRFVPAGAPAAVGAPVPDTIAAALAGVPVRISAPTGTAPLPYVGDDGDDAISAPVADDGGSAQLSVAPARVEPTEVTHSGVDHEREPESEPHAVKQLLRDEPHDHFGHPGATNVPTGAPSATSDPAGAAATISHESRTGFVELNLPTGTGALPSSVSVPIEPDPSAAAPGAGPAPTVPVSDAPPIDVPPAPDEPPPDPAPRAWLDGPLDLLGGVPLRDAVSIDLSALGTGAEQFLAGVVGLGPDRSESTEWGAYFWPAGAVVLLCGGAQFARAVRRTGGGAVSDVRIETVLGRVNSGDAAAAEQLHAAYAAYVRAVVRRRLSARLRTRLDSADVAQSVWVQVVRRIGAGWRVETEHELRAVLAVIARRRVATRARARAPDSCGSALAALPAAREPTPSQVAGATDLWDRMLALCPPEHRDVLRLRRDGLPLAEVAARTGLHEGSVRRILRRLFRALALSERAGSLPPDPGTDQ